MKKVVACLLGSVCAQIDTKAADSMAAIALSVIDNAQSSNEQLARAGNVLSQLNLLENRHKTQVCKNVQTSQDKSIKDSFYEAELHHLYACPTLKASVKETSAKLRNAAAYDTVEDHWFAL